MHALICGSYRSPDLDVQNLATSFKLAVESPLDMSIFLVHNNLTWKDAVRPDARPGMNSVPIHGLDIQLKKFFRILQNIASQEDNAKPYLPDVAHWGGILLSHRMHDSSPASGRSPTYDSSQSSYVHQDPKLILNGIDATMRFKRNSREKLMHRRVFRSNTGLIGLCPLSSVEEDKVWLLPGGSTPYVLRPLENGHYMFLGEAYAYGIMYGEGLEWADDAREITME